MVPYDLQLPYPDYTEMKHSNACLDSQVYQSKYISWSISCKDV